MDVEAKYALEMLYVAHRMLYDAMEHHQTSMQLDDMWHKYHAISHFVSEAILELNSIKEGVD